MTKRRPTHRLWCSRFLSRPHEFLAEHASQQGDHVWFKEPAAPWLVIHHPDDVAALAALPPHLADGSRIKRAIVPWLTNDILPGMHNDDSTQGRRELAETIQHLKSRNLEACVDQAAASLQVQNECRIDLHQWCGDAAVQFANAFFSDWPELQQCSDVCKTAEPIGWSPLLSRWLTHRKMRKLYSRFAKATGCANHEHRHYRQMFLLYSGFVVNIASALRHVFSQLLREGNHIRLQLQANDIDDASRRQLIQATCNESLRLTPLLVFIVRQISEDINFRDMQVKRGTVIAACPFLTHHREDIYDSPSAFLPARHDSQFTNSQYYPFGIGARSCPINALARDVLALFVDHITARFDLRLDGAQQNPITFSRSLLATTRVHRDMVWIERLSAKVATHAR